MRFKLSLHTEKQVHVFPKKPRALATGSRAAVFAPSSPADPAKKERGVAELKKMGFSVECGDMEENEAYFAAPAARRSEEFLKLLARPDVSALFALRGGYGSNYLLDFLKAEPLPLPKCLIGYSDVTSLHIFLWQQCGWVTFYGPMVAAGLDAGSGVANGYDPVSLQDALTNTKSGWSLYLGAAPLANGQCEGCLLGGCMTLVEATLGTPWELETKDSILLLEDRAMRPWQVDRVLMHLKQAGKFEGVQGIVLGEFPECQPVVAGSPTVRDVCERILAPLGVPVVFGAAIGHTPRPMLTVPLGVRARLRAEAEGVLEILESAVVE